VKKIMDELKRKSWFDDGIGLAVWAVVGLTLASVFLIVTGVLGWTM